MSRKIIMAGKLKPGFQKPNNMQEIINKINKLNINKNQKYILFIAAIRIIEDKKENIRLIKQLEEMKNETEIYNNFSKSKYISNIITTIKTLDKQKYLDEINIILKYVKENNIEI